VSCEIPRPGAAAGVEGTVEGKQIHTEHRRQETQVSAGTTNVVGLYRQEKIKTRKVKPGDKLHYLSYEPPSTTSSWSAQRQERRETRYSRPNGSTKAREKRRLLRVEATPDRLDAMALACSCRP